MIALQFIFSPVFISVILSTLVTLEGKPSQVVSKLQQVVQLLQLTLHISLFVIY